MNANISVAGDILKFIRSTNENMFSFISMIFRRGKNLVFVQWCITGVLIRTFLDIAYFIFITFSDCSFNYFFSLDERMNCFRESNENVKRSRDWGFRIYFVSSTANAIPACFYDSTSQTWWEMHEKHKTSFRFGQKTSRIFYSKFGFMLSHACFFIFMKFSIMFFRCVRSLYAFCHFPLMQQRNENEHKCIKTA